MQCHLEYENKYDILEIQFSIKMLIIIGRTEKTVKISCRLHADIFEATILII